MKYRKTIKRAAIVAGGVSRVDSDEQFQYLDVIIEPTQNCQLFVIGAIESVIRQLYGTKGKKKERTLEYVKQMLYKAWEASDHKKMALIDIGKSYYKYLSAVIPESRIILKAPFKSTNGNSRLIVIFDARALNQ